ncbi:zincin-like metallopeptidase domain-containing protein [Flavobacterium sp.]|uniref:zincin-like metallopeptidase domain-containing protein n=1 Tax=Flavobacterium sp. TaxID=239 RepID=UPI0037511809
MKSIQQFNGLNGLTVSRKQLLALVEIAKKDEQFHLSKKIITVLDQTKDKKYLITIAEPVHEIVPQSFLYDLGFEQFVDDDLLGLNKAVSSTDIYQMITDRMVEMIKKANTKNFKKTWEAKQYGTGYTLPFNFVSKKRYRGVNVFLLTNFEILKNPFFLTFKQIEQLGGTIKKGSHGYPIVYYTKIYKVKDATKSIDFGTYDNQKAIDFATENAIDVDKISEVPILKYYNVFNGNDIDGIDFDLENFKTGFIDIELPSEEANKMQVPEAIIKNYPQPAPKLKFGGNDAFYNSGKDLVQMPYLNDFVTVQDYYRVLLHEYSHSTGRYSRLNRTFGKRFGDKDYAFEELVAEFGATFLSAEAGIIWHTNGNHAAYLKNWNSALTHIQNDNKFIFRASSLAQKLSDYILQFDKKGNPLYFKDIKITPVKKTSRVQFKKQTVKSTQLDLFAGLGATNSKEPDTIAFNKKLIRAIKKGYGNDEIFFLGKPKDELKKHIENFEIKIVGSVLTKATTQKAGHKLNWGNFLDLPDFINNPTAIFKSKTTGYVVLTEIKDVENNPVMVALHIDKKFKMCNIASMYVRNSFNTYKTWIKQGLAIYINEKSELFTKTPATIAIAVKNSLSKDNKNNTKKTNNGLNCANCNVNCGLSCGCEVKEPGNKITEVKPKVTVLSGTKYSTAFDQQSDVKVVNDYFKISGDLKKLLGNIEIKPIHSLAITLDSPEGGGKTHTVFQWANDFCNASYKPIIWSLEEHKSSSLSIDKAKKYFKGENIKKIAVESENDGETPKETYDRLQESCKDFDVIIIDSWAKLVEMYSKVSFDLDFRKKFNGKLFIVIFQRTSTGAMRGGTKSGFDGDIILKGFVDRDNFMNNYVFNHKNRYNQHSPISDLKYSPALQKLLPIKNEKTRIKNLDQPKRKLSFKVVD